MAGGGWSHQRLCIIDIYLWDGFSADHGYQIYSTAGC